MMQWVLAQAERNFMRDTIVAHNVHVWRPQFCSEEEKGNRATVEFILHYAVYTQHNSRNKFALEASLLTHQIPISTTVQK